MTSSTPGEHDEDLLHYASTKAARPVSTFTFIRHTSLSMLSLRSLFTKRIRASPFQGMHGSMSWSSV